MGFNTTLTNVLVFNNTAIRTTTVQNSTPVLMDQLEETVAVVANTLDQAVTIGTQMSMDNGSTWLTIGNTVSVPNGTSIVVNQFDGTLTGIRILSGQLRLTATASSAPTTGGLTAYLQGMAD